MDEPWNSPHNRALSNRMPAIYRCPSENDTSNKTNYAMLVGPHAFSTGPKGRTRDEITDGPSNTIMIAETVGGNLNWLEPRDLDVETMGFDPVENPGKEISSNHRNTITVLFADGNVQSISKAADPDTIKSFTTIDGGEQATLEDTFSFE
jgi:prepilin-type processing-associated H-X9-DG protein